MKDAELAVASLPRVSVTLLRWFLLAREKHVWSTVHGTASKATVTRTAVEGKQKSQS
jgi:hypothetical protein